MASRLHLIAVGCDRARLDDALRDAVAHLELLERRWSRFIPSSDVSRINAIGDVGGRLQVDPSTLTLLAAMLEGYQVTAGRYDPTVLHDVIAEGYVASKADPRVECRVAPRRGRRASLYDLAVEPLLVEVVVPPGFVVDPGGIGKGLAADLTVAALLAAGAEGALVEIGGDLSMGGTPPDTGTWLVDVEHPDPDDGTLCTLATTGGGLATSSVRSNRWLRDGRERHHQIDPATGACSATDLLAVTVSAPTGWLAEVHATAALAVGGESVVAYLEGHGLSGIAIGATPQGHQVLSTPNLAGCGRAPASASR